MWDVSTAGLIKRESELGPGHRRNFRAQKALPEGEPRSPSAKQEAQDEKKEVQTPHPVLFSTSCRAGLTDRSVENQRQARHTWRDHRIWEGRSCCWVPHWPIQPMPSCWQRDSPMKSCSVCLGFASAELKAAAKLRPSPSSLPEQVDRVKFLE